MAEPLPQVATATLNALLAGPDPVCSALRGQIPHARVTGRCGCGCATLDLTVDQSAVPPAPVHGNPAADAWYAVPDDAGVMAFTEGGYLSRLEIHSASEPITAWPEPHFLKL
ncbi:hypothetical protein OG539_26290 [Actinacidiphila glaucinigra]|uniref:hypothetical protein n=1 Tax=Actinacidiphila glaucinigra TaxID=235986 RepID=UPI002DD8C9F9|nr:hypothetical protein [Actinacidiphila glaucinigra]WSD60426.1 hypothetical protein OIE69_16615 [Actinacidiphila glaucinigra]